MGYVCGIWITISKEVNTFGSNKTEIRMYVVYVYNELCQFEVSDKWSYVQHFGTFHDLSFFVSSQ